MTDALDLIVKRERNVRYRRYPDSIYVDGVTQAGEDVHMQDGSVWFHPYDGGAPRKIK